MSNLGFIRALQLDAAQKNQKESVAKAANEAEGRLEELQLLGDLEQAHIDADKVLCDLLTALGFGSVVAEFEAIDKYYG
ncbi:MAG: hypothetical protein HKM95_14110 [Inquilinus sp.]|nr:hypothetical protein [Inquilinus sp.]